VPGARASQVARARPRKRHAAGEEADGGANLPRHAERGRTANVTATGGAAGDSACVCLRPPRPGDRGRTTLVCEQEPGNPVTVVVDVDVATGNTVGVGVCDAWT